MPDKELETRIVTLQMQAESGDLNAAAAAVGQVLDRLDDLDKKTQQWEKETEKVRKKYESMLPQINKISRGIDSIHGAAQKAASAIGTIGDALGAGGISIAFAQGTKTVIEYNKQLIGLSAQYAKYGKGITEVEKRMLGLGRKLALTRTDMMDLYKTMEKGLPIASLEATEKILTNIRNIVGTNKQAISEMAGNLVGLLSTYPSLQKAAEDMSDTDRTRLGNVIKMELASGRMSLQQAKGLSDYVSKNKQASKVDEERLKKADEMVKMQGKMKKLYEEILFKIGGAILPVVQALAGFIERHKDDILKTAEFFGKWIAPLLLAKSILGNMVGAVGSLTKGLGGMFSGLKGLGGTKGNKVFVTNWPASMKAPGMGAGFGAAGMLKLGMAGAMGYHGGGALGRGIGKRMGLGKRGMETADDLGSIAGAGLAGGMVAGPIGAAVAAAGAAIWKFAKILDEFNKAKEKVADVEDKNYKQRLKDIQAAQSRGALTKKQADEERKVVVSMQKRAQQQRAKDYVQSRSIAGAVGLGDTGVGRAEAWANTQMTGLVASMMEGLGMKKKSVQKMEARSAAWQNKDQPLSPIYKKSQEMTRQMEKDRQQRMIRHYAMERQFDKERAARL
ncbi:MAG: hypothetical protein ACTSQA_05020, partial [Candidatus Heimdallarchaeaceae archaeon]